MNLWVLDTDTLSLLHHHHPGVTAQALCHPVDRVAVSVVTVKEAFFGRYNRIQRAKSPDELIAAFGQLEASISLIRQMPILSNDADAAEVFADLRRKYRRIAKTDLQIAAIAMSHQATLVTCNFADFGQIEGLSLQDWTK